MGLLRPPVMVATTRILTQSLPHTFSRGLVQPPVVGDTTRSHAQVPFSYQNQTRLWPHVVGATTSSRAYKLLFSWFCDLFTCISTKS